MNISFDLRENGCHRPSGLDGRMIVVVRQADETLAVYNFVKFNNFSSRVH